MNATPTRVTHQPAREHGQVLPLAALLLTALFGLGALAIDAGLAYAQRTRAQGAADNAAVAAAQAASAGATRAQAIQAAIE
ncbi:MAG: pilus assembly protein TadE, partial [Dehalococcoidia bacterium]